MVLYLLARLPNLNFSVFSCSCTFWGLQLTHVWKSCIYIYIVSLSPYFLQSSSTWSNMCLLYKLNAWAINFRSLVWILIVACFMFTLDLGDYNRLTFCYFHHVHNGINKTMGLAITTSWIWCFNYMHVNSIVSWINLQVQHSWLNLFIKIICLCRRFII